MALLLAASTHSAQAGLLGATVNVSVFHPDTNSVYQAGSNVTVSGAVEYPTGTFAQYNTSWQIDITDTSIRLFWDAGFPFSYLGAPFNGWILTIISGPEILSAVTNAASHFNPIGISIRNGNQLLLNYSEVVGPGFGVSIIDIRTGPTPCPNTFTVTTGDDSGPGSLRQAILDANACPGTNRIDFAPSAHGTILLTSGELLISDHLFINGPGANNVAVDGNAAGRVFHITPGKNVIIAGLAITNGLANSIPGAGIYNDHAALTIRNCTISDNSAIGAADGAGGGIFSDGQGGSASLHIANSTVSGNSAFVSGGGIFNFFGTLAVSNCVIANNSAGAIGYGGGGGIVSAALGSLGSANLRVVNSTVSSNSAGRGRGGGIWNNGERGNVSAEIINSTLNGNSAGDGGAIFNDGFGGRAVLRLFNTTLSGNSGKDGGGIYNYGLSGLALAMAINSTLSDNSALTQGGGIYNYGNLGRIELGSTILNAGASGENIFNVFGGAVTSIGYNLSSDDAGGSLRAATDQTNINPMLGPLQDNGGPTFTHALLCRSPAVDGGKNFSASPTDQRDLGFARIFDDPSVANALGGDGSDIGAFEAQQPLPDCNQPPVAVIRVSPLINLPGVTNLIAVAANNAGACVTLDGSLSFDADQDALTYLWFNEPNPAPVASGVSAMVCLSVGAQTVRLVVTDTHGASGTAAVTVAVITPCEAIRSLAATLENFAPVLRNKQPLVATLNAACASFNRGDLRPGGNQLRAFQNQVSAQIAPSNPVLAQQLIETSQAIIDALGGP